MLRRGPSEGDLNIAHPDLDELLDPMLSFAREMLSTHGEFLPFGVQMSQAGEVTYVAATTEDDDESPPSQEIVDLLVEGAREQASRGDLRAVGVCLDVWITPAGETEKTDAICARLEHVSGEVLDVYLPYGKDSGGRVSYGELFAAPGRAKVFNAVLVT